MSLEPKEHFKIQLEVPMRLCQTRSSSVNVSIRHRLLSIHKPSDLPLSDAEAMGSSHSLLSSTGNKGKGLRICAQHHFHCVLIRVFVCSNVSQYATLVSAAPPAGGLSFISIAFISSYDFSPNLMYGHVNGFPSPYFVWQCLLDTTWLSSVGSYG